MGKLLKYAVPRLENDHKTTSDVELPPDKVVDIISVVVVVVFVVVVFEGLLKIMSAIFGGVCTPPPPLVSDCKQLGGGNQGIP